jgi:ubiquitin fusion degradation protein 1
VEYVSPDSDEQKGKSKAKDTQDEANNKPWGEGQKLGRGTWKPSGMTGAGGASVPAPPNRTSTAKQMEKDRSPSPDWGVDDDEMIEYESD